MSSNPETALQKAILEALAFDKNIQVWRSNTGAGNAASGRFIRYGLAKGASDIVGIVKMEVCWAHTSPRDLKTPASPEEQFKLLGRFIALEVKVGKGQPTLEQHEFLALVRRMGGHAAVVRSIDEALSQVAQAKGL